MLEHRASRLLVLAAAGWFAACSGASTRQGSRAATAPRPADPNARALACLEVGPAQATAGTCPAPEDPAAQEDFVTWPQKLDRLFADQRAEILCCLDGAPRFQSGAVFQIAVPPGDPSPFVRITATDVSLAEQECLTRVVASWTYPLLCLPSSMEVPPGAGPDAPAAVVDYPVRFDEP